MIKIVQNGKGAAAVLFAIGIGFILSGIVFFIMEQMQTQYCMAASIFGIVGLFAISAGVHGKDYNVVIKMDDEKLTIIGPQYNVRECKLDDMEKAEIVRKRNGSYITFYPRESSDFIIDSAGISPEDMERLISAVKDAGYSHDFDVIEKGESGRVALSPEKIEGTNEKGLFSAVRADEEDAPYKVK